MRPYSAPLFALLLAATAPKVLCAQDDLKTATYVDSSTGISFESFADGTGYRFGMALPQSSSSTSSAANQAIMQLVSPLSSSGSGWAGIVFGESMTGKLMLVAWPNGGSGGVTVSARIATGYEIATGANLYTRRNVTTTAIAGGTYANATHVVATFVCDGCLDNGATSSSNGDSFVAGDGASGNADDAVTMGFAYATAAVADPGNPDSTLSDHTAHGEPYGSFSFPVTRARSDQFAQWVALAANSSSSSGSEGTGNGTASGSGSGGSTTGSTTTTTTTTGDEATQPAYLDESGTGRFSFMMVMVCVIYLVQPFLN
jgi:cellobiose dehydrogenase (acceptor)